MKSLFKLPQVLWIFFTLVVYSSVLISPLFFKYSGIVSFGVPLVLLLNFLLLIASLFFKWKSGFIALVLLIVGYPFLQVSFSFGGREESTSKSVSIMNYNVKWFVDAKKDNYEEVIDWMDKVDVDIMCFQEFYPLKNISPRIAQKGYRASLHKDQFHVAIYSRYPIINEGLVFTLDELNNARFADIKIGKDTLRVYSVHLESMGINPDKIQNPEGIKLEYENVKNRFITASARRTRQIKELLAHAASGPRKHIFAGDFNDVPFSYNYFQFKKKYKNAFEEAGRGMGVTYNGKLPFLRIDNQFYSQGIKALELKTVNDVYYSDHFPLIGIYDITP